MFPTEINGVEITGIKERRGPCPPNYENITSVVIPYGYTFVGNRAFSGCYNLKEIDIAPTVESIGVKAFEGCAIERIVLPATLTYISGFSEENGGKQMLDSCHLLKDVYWLAKSIDAEANPFGKGHSFTLHGEADLTVKKYAPQKKCIPLSEKERRMLAQHFFAVPKPAVLVGEHSFLKTLKIGDEIACTTSKDEFSSVLNDDGNLMAKLFKLSSKENTAFDYDEFRAVVGLEKYVTLLVTKEMESLADRDYVEVTICFKE